MEWRQDIRALVKGSEVPEIDKLFDKLDTDQDGFIKKTEMEDLALAFFHGAEPGGHADWLFGPPPK